jgi:hypothetical protein
MVRDSTLRGRLDRQGDVMILSIGLNVGAGEPDKQLARTLSALNRRARVLDVAVGVSEWQGRRERMLQARVDSRRCDELAASLARDLNQECVSVLGDDEPRWALVSAAGDVSIGGAIADYPIILKGDQ